MSGKAAGKVGCSVANHAVLRAAPPMATVSNMVPRPCAIRAWPRETKHSEKSQRKHSEKAQRHANKKQNTASNETRKTWACVQACIVARQLPLAANSTELVFDYSAAVLGLFVQFSITSIVHRMVPFRSPLCVMHREGMCCIANSRPIHVSAMASARHRVLIDGNALLALAHLPRLVAPLHMCRPHKKTHCATAREGGGTAALGVQWMVLPAA